MKHMEAVSKELNCPEWLQPAHIPIDEAHPPTFEERPLIQPMSRALLEIEKGIAEMALPPAAQVPQGQYPVGATGVVLTFFVGGKAPMDETTAEFEHASDDDGAPQAAASAMSTPPASPPKKKQKKAATPKGKGKGKGKGKKTPPPKRQSSRLEKQKLKEKEDAKKARAELADTPVHQLHPHENFVLPGDPTIPALLERALQHPPSPGSPSGTVRIFGRLLGIAQTFSRCSPFMQFSVSAERCDGRRRERHLACRWGVRTVSSGQ